MAQPLAISDQDRAITQEMRGLEGVPRKLDALRPEEVSKGLKARDTEAARKKELVKDILKYLGIMLKEVVPFVGWTTTIMSTLAAVVIDATAAASKQQEVESKIDQLEAVLDQFTKHADQLTQTTTTLVASFPPVTDPSFNDAYALLKASYGALAQMQRLGKTIQTSMDGPVAALFDRFKAVQMKGSVAAETLATRLYFLRSQASRTLGPAMTDISLVMRQVENMH